MEYSGGRFFGNESGTPTRTLLSFLITSIGGNYEDMICFFPQVTLNWKVLLKHFEIVLKAIQEVGFHVVVVILDGHKTNMRFFVELCGGRLKISIQNPADINLPLYLTFDPVHVFKNFYNNFERRK
jgi:hypothetical protein